MKGKVDLLLVTIPDLAFGHKMRLAGMPPLGLAYIKAYAVQAGFSCRIINLFSLPSKKFMDMEPAIRAVCEIDFQILGVGAQEHDFFDLVDFCGEIRKRRLGIKIMVGGYIGFSYKELLETCSAIDYVVVGEGEETVPFMLKEILNGERGIENIKGLAYRSSGGIRFTGMRDQIRDVEDLLPPDLSDTPPYFKDGVGRHHMVTSRGCFNRGCNYCSTELMHLNYRTMSPYKVGQEIETISQKYPGLGVIHFDDDSYDLGRFPAIIEELAMRGLGRFKFIFQSTARNILKNKSKLEDKNLKSAIGEIHLGLESFNGAQLMEYNKRISPEENWQAVEILHELGINFLPYIIVDRTPGRIESAMPKLTHPIFWPRLDGIQPLLNHPHTRIAEVSQSFFRGKEEKRTASATGLKKKVEERYNVIWKIMGTPKYDMGKLTASWDRQRKMARRFNVQPWQDAFCAMMRPWFDGLDTVVAELRGHIHYGESIKHGLIHAEKKGDIEEVQMLQRKMKACAQAVKKIHSLPEVYWRHALSVGRLVEMGEYDIYSVPFANLVLAARHLVYKEINSCLEGLRP